MYFLMSLWFPYNVFLMKSKLKFVDCDPTRQKGVGE